MAVRLCSWSGCTRAHHARGLCPAHYKRVEAHLREAALPWPADSAEHLQVLMRCGGVSAASTKDSASVRCRWDGCSKSPRVLGLCVLHYHRMLRAFPLRKRGVAFTTEQVNQAIIDWDRAHPTGVAEPCPEKNTENTMKTPTANPPTSAPVKTLIDLRKPEVERAVQLALAETMPDLTLRDGLALAAKITQHLGSVLGLG